MRNSGLRVLVLLMLLFAVTSADAALLKVEFDGPTAYLSEDWAGPGTPPTSFALSFTVDTLSFTSSSVTYIGNETGEIQTSRFYGVGVQSVSFIANETELWDDPAGLTLDFGGDFPSIEPEGGFCFCFFGNSIIPASRGLGLSYVAVLPPRSQLGSDPLAVILLAQTPLYLGVLVNGEWAHVQGNGPVSVSEIPIPSAVWLLATGLAGVGGRGWLRRKFTS